MSRRSWAYSVCTARCVVALVAATSIVLLSVCPAQAQQAMAAPTAVVAGTTVATLAKRSIGPLVFDHVNIVDVRSGKIQREQRVVIVGNRIRSVGRATGQLPFGAARVINARGKYLIPGLWDMHVHALDNANPYLSFIVHGVTGVRDMATYFPLDSVHRWRREIAAGQRIGPRIIAAGPYLEADTSIPNRLAVIVATPPRARHVVDSLQAAGADFIKVHFNRNSVTRETFFAILAEARKVGIPVDGHQAESVSLAEASDSGQRTVEHLGFLTTPCWKTDRAGRRQCAAEMAHLVRHKTWITPTLVGLGGAFDATGVSGDSSSAAMTDSTTAPQHGTVQSGLWLVRRLRSFGVGFLAASDAQTGLKTDMVIPDSEPTPDFAGQVHRELELLVRAGLTPLEALRTATLNPAMALDATDSLGTVAANKLADLVLLDADPLADIRNAAKISAVVADGRYYDRAAFDLIMAEVRRGMQGR